MAEAGARRFIHGRGAVARGAVAAAMTFPTANACAAIAWAWFWV